jgi:hypothetical protein
MVVSFMFINPCSRLKIDGAAYTGGQEKYIKYVNFAWPLVEAELSMSAFCFLLTRDWKLFVLHFAYGLLISETNCLTSSIHKYNF